MTGERPKLDRVVASYVKQDRVLCGNRMSTTRGPSIEYALRPLETEPVRAARSWRSRRQSPRHGGLGLGEPLNAGG